MSAATPGQAPDRETLIAAATEIHDGRCGKCDRKYRMSCPDMANAVLEAGKRLREAAATPGQAEYETWRAAVPDWVCNVPAGPWDELSPGIQAGFAAIAAQEPKAAPEQRAELEAAIREHVSADCDDDPCSPCEQITGDVMTLADAYAQALAAQGAQPAPGLRKALEAKLAEWRDDALYHPADTHDEIVDHRAVTACADTLAGILADHPDAEPQPAPELAAAIPHVATDPDAHRRHGCPTCLAENRHLRADLRTLAELWEASAAKDDKAAAITGKDWPRQLLEERAASFRLCAADIRKLAGPAS